MSLPLKFRTESFCSFIITALILSENLNGYFDEHKEPYAHNADSQKRPNSVDKIKHDKGPPFPPCT